MTKNELVSAISMSLFSDRETLAEAYDYALEVAKATDNPAGVMTAIQVLTNTIANEIRKLED